MANFDGLKQPGGFTGQDFGYDPSSVAAGFLSYAPNSASADQKQALNYAQAAAQGTGPSAAVQQLAAAQQRNNTDAFALAAMGQGGNLASMQQAAQARAAAAQMQSAQAAAGLRAQEQQVGMAAYADQANALAQQRLQYEQLGQQGIQAGRDSAINYELGKGQLDLERQKYHTDRNMGWAKVAAGAVGGVIGGLLKSDERVKHDIMPAGGSAAATVGAVPSYSYEYDAGAGPAGRRFGPMAQDLERVAPELVVETPQGKAIDTGGLSALNTAAISEQQQQIAALAQQLNYADQPQELTGGMRAASAIAGGLNGFAGLPPPKVTRPSDKPKPVLIKMPGSEGWIARQPGIVSYA